MKEAFSRIDTLKSFLSQILSFKTFRVKDNLESAKQGEVMKEAFSRIEEKREINE
jgi:hypothetical protein